MRPPLLEKCCCGIPLRYGLIIWGCLKLIVSTIISIALSVILYKNVNSIPDPFEGPFYVYGCIVLIILLTDVVVNTLFFIGGHTKNLKFLQAYYIYNIVFLCLIISLVLVTFFLMVPLFYFDCVIEYFSSSFVSITMQSYFVVLLRSQVIKLRNNCKECVIEYKEGMVDEEKGTEDVREETCLTNGTFHKNEDQN